MHPPLRFPFRNGDAHFLLRPHLRSAKSACLGHMSVGKQRPMELIGVCTAEEVLVSNDQFVPVQGELQRLHYVFRLFKMRLRHPVSAHQSVVQEVVIARHVGPAIIPAVSEERAAVLLRQQPLVDEVPDEPALEDVVLAEEVPVFLETAEAVAHGVSVFAEDERPHLRVVQCVPFERVVMRVHVPDDVGVPLVHGPFVGHKPRAVLGLGPQVELVKVVPVARFIAHRPNDDARVVAVAFDHALHAAHVGVEPSRIVAQRPVQIVPHAVRFDVGLVVHVQAVFVAEVVPVGVVGVMRGAHCVEVVGLHQADVLAHGFARNHVPRFEVVFVAVHAFDEYRLAVDEQLFAPDLDFAESDAFLDGLNAPSFRIVLDQVHFVQVRGFRRPQKRVRHPGGQPRSAVDGFRSPRARNRRSGVRKPSRHFWCPPQPSLLPKHIHG